jgi:site-specific recombinase XerD
MKTKSVKSFGSLVVRGSRFYAFWRVKDSTGETKAICKALRDDDGAAITTRPEAEKAKLALMEIVHKKKQVKSLLSIQHTIDDTQADIKRLQDKEHPPLALAQTWSEFVSPTSGRNTCNKSSLRLYECRWSMFHSWLQQNHTGVATLCDVNSTLAKAYLDSLIKRGVSPATYNGHLNVLRLGDCATLKWNEVDLKRQQIRRVPRKTARRKPVATVIPIHPVLADILAEIPANERGAYVNPKTAGVYLSCSPSLVTNEIQKHFQDCGIETTHKRENGIRVVVDVGFHSLRHTFVSMARESGAPLSVVESIVGHSSVGMTRHYTHTSIEAAQSAIALLPAVNGDATEITKPTGRTRDELLREIIESMTAKNLRKKKADALAMFATATA